MFYLKLITFIIASKTFVLAWDSAQLEVFDAVEEIKVNFYELLNVTQV